MNMLCYVTMNCSITPYFSLWNGLFYAECYYRCEPVVQLYHCDSQIIVNCHEFRQYTLWFRKYKCITASSANQIKCHTYKTKTVSAS